MNKGHPFLYIILFLKNRDSFQNYFKLILYFHLFNQIHFYLIYFENINQI